ncbi:MAG: 30S ribosomal protein S6 [Candidatus Liberibacter europaeus]|uniref:Small ribosomal subunit protein bS6 n=1 Tax=Candidatus Liberibacter europaeus TaxID=744859 RepID=A0A2T4VXU7_9HYPH|nr:30S ribosomal protein S6 [Candidatus Liberibacter europaeus]PTL86602.1 MAG: 30S ribosomal protein S6 [Candidatus Liberibacter europaeus]
MKLYEHVFILRQDVSTQQVKDAIERYKGLIRENGGEVSLVDEWGTRTMAYHMKKNRRGTYILMNISAPPTAIQEMERKMNIDENILRHFTILVKSHDDSPSVTAHKHDRDNRHDRSANDRNFERKNHLSEEKTLS